MKNRVRLTAKQKVDIIEAYSTNLEPMISIAARYALSRQGVHKILRQAGIDTGKTSANIQVSCSACGKVFTMHRCRVRKQLHTFCSQECYFAFLHCDHSRQSRAGQMRGRATVSEHFALQDGHVVHHEDHDTLNNTLQNLRVFATQGDHVRHHRGFDVQPIWDGRYL
jgi:hypothetical protein